MLNIEDLKLTPEEYRQTLQRELPGGFSYFSPQIVADAQLGKVLWGVQKWLEEEHPIGGGVWLDRVLRDQLLVLGIARA